MATKICTCGIDYEHAPYPCEVHRSCKCPCFGKRDCPHDGSHHWVRDPNGFRLVCTVCEEIRTMEHVRGVQEPLDDYFGAQWEQKTGKTRRKVPSVVDGIRIIDLD